MWHRIPAAEGDKFKSGLDRKLGQKSFCARSQFGPLFRMRIRIVILGLVLSVPLWAAEKPNVLFVAIDDLNDWTGCLEGHPQVQTPHMDRLAQRGTLFLNAHCQSPLCNPCRTSLLTGLRPSTTGVYGLAPWFRTIPAFKDRVTLPQYFKRNGYTTYSTGKIYHGGYPPREEQADEFDHWGPPATVGARPPTKLVQTPFGNHPLVDWGTFPHRDEDKGDWKVASWAVQQLETKPKEPFFLAVGFFLPHVPCYATEKWFDLYPDESLALPPVLAGDRDDTPRFSWYLHWKLPEPRLSWLQKNQQWRTACARLPGHHQFHGQPARPRPGCPGKKQLPD